MHWLVGKRSLPVSTTRSSCVLHWKATGHILTDRIEASGGTCVVAAGIGHQGGGIGAVVAHTGAVVDVLDEPVHVLADLRAGSDGHTNASISEAASLPLNAQVAFQQASCLARNLLQARSGGPLEPFHYRDLGEMMSLGRGDASLIGGGFTLAGPAAFQLRKLAYLTRLPGRSHQLRVAAGWLANLPG